MELYGLLVLLCFGIIKCASEIVDETNISNYELQDLKQSDYFRNESSVEEKVIHTTENNHSSTLLGRQPQHLVKKLQLQKRFETVLDFGNRAFPGNAPVQINEDRILQVTTTTPEPLLENVIKEKPKPKFATCRQTINEASGTVTSPSFPNMTESDEDCEWKISATPGERITLNITNLKVFQEDNCQHNFIEIKDGFGHKSNIIGKVCGRSPESELFFTSGFRMMVVFRTSRHHTGLKAFTANFQAICGGDFQSEEGEIFSPNYPDPYKPDKSCVWNIAVPEPYLAVLILNFFEVEYSDNCEYDYVEVHDGQVSNSTLIGKYCGKRIPKEIRSSTNNMAVTFSSDNSKQETGFSATFSKDLDECAAGTHRCEHDCINTVGSYICGCPRGFKLKSDRRNCEAICGGNMFQAGDIKSPNYPENYISDIRCVWKVNFPDSAQVLLKFHTFKVEYQQNCHNDFVEVRSGHELNNKLLARFCGRLVPEMVLSPTNQMMVTFASDSSFEEEGFLASITKEYDECKLNRHTCEHKCVNVVGGSYYCECRDGYELQPDGASCEALCGEAVSGDTGLIVYAPKTSEAKSGKVECVWKITVPSSYKAALKISDSPSKVSENCENSYMEFRDGFRWTSNLLGKYSCSNLTNELVSSTNSLKVTLVTDTRSGRFSAQFVKEIDECNGNSHNCHQKCVNTVGGYICACNTGVLQSDNRSCSWSCGGRLLATQTESTITSHSEYGSRNYVDNQLCTWKIVASSGRRVRVQVTSSNLEFQAGCEYDYLEISYTDRNNANVVWNKFCGDQISAPLTSPQNEVTIIFRSDGSNTAGGFSLMYKEV